MLGGCQSQVLMFFGNALSLPNFLAEKDQECRENEGEGTDSSEQPKRSGEAYLVRKWQSVESDVECVD